MKDTTPVVDLARFILDGLQKAYKAGGYGLTLLCVGALLMILAFGLSLKGPDNHLVAAAFLAGGTACIAFVAFIFYQEAIAPTRQATRRAKDNEQLLKAVQVSALCLANIIQEINDYTLFHANEIVEGINSAKGVLRAIPIANRVLDIEQFQRADDFAQAIRNYVRTSRSVVTDIREAVSECDPARLKPRLEALKQLQTYVEAPNE